MVEKEIKEPNSGSLVVSDCQGLLRMSEEYIDNFVKHIKDNNFSEEETQKLLSSIYQKLGLKPSAINNFAGNQVIGQYQLIVDGDMLSKLVGGLATALKDNFGEETGASIFRELCKAFIDKL